MKVEIKVGDQLYINNKWYFDVIDINDNILQVRIQYKENTNNKEYFYKLININKDLITNVEDGVIKKCVINEIELKKSIGGLINRIKKEIDMSFIYENVSASTSSNSSGFGDVSMPTLSGIPGVAGDAGSADINITNSDKKKKKKKKIKASVKSPFIPITKTNENVNDLEYKQIIINIINYPEKSDIDEKFITDIENKSDLLLGLSSTTVNNYFNDLINLNKTLYDKTSPWLKEYINTILDLNK